MAIELVTKFAPYTDEIFHKESKKSLLTNNDFEWTGAHTVNLLRLRFDGSNPSSPTKQKVLILCGFSQVKTFCFFNLFAFQPLFSSIFSSHSFAARV